MGIEPTPKLGKLILEREKGRIDGILRFSMFLKWIPIEAASSERL
jgi:hypothetical protein